MFCLFSLITGTQYVAAIIAHSLALQADCVSMGKRPHARYYPIPCLNHRPVHHYCVRSHRRSIIPGEHGGRVRHGSKFAGAAGAADERSVPGAWSFRLCTHPIPVQVCPSPHHLRHPPQGLLGYFTGYFFIEASRSVGLLPAHGGEEEVVDPYIVVFFAGLGILFDVLSLCSYKALTSPPHFTPTRPHPVPRLLYPFQGHLIW